MGGHAFSSDDTIETPRMSPNVYQLVLKQVETILSEFFEIVAHTIEAPEKKSYGDLDVMVVSKPKLPALSSQEIAHRLHAVKWFTVQKGVAYEFAVPWPEKSNDSRSLSVSDNDDFKRPTLETIQSGKNVLHENNVTQQSPRRKCVQLDLTICSSRSELRWKLFESAHSDFGRLISTMIRSRGLTMNTKALYLRIATVETHNRRAARVELSKDPDQVLKYLGLDVTKFWTSFSTLDDMMKFVATCRFFTPKKSQLAIDDTQPETDLSDPQPTKDDLIAQKKRPVFNYWFDSFLPTHRNLQPGKDAHLTREETLQDVFDFFGREIQQAYETQKATAETEIARTTLWPSIRAEIRKQDPDLSDPDLEQTIRSLKRVVQRGVTITTKNNKEDKSRNIEYARVHEAFKSGDFPTVTSWSIREHENVLLAHRHGDFDSTSAPIRVSLRSTTISASILPLPSPSPCPDPPGNEPSIPATDIPPQMQTQPQTEGVAQPNAQSHTETSTNTRPLETPYFTFSTRPIEAYTPADDEVILRMKGEEGASWTEILDALGKKSKSQLQEYWKRELVGRMAKSVNVGSGGSGSGVEGGIEAGSGELTEGGGGGEDKHGHGHAR